MPGLSTFLCVRSVSQIRPVYALDSKDVGNLHVATSCLVGSKIWNREINSFQAMERDACSLSMQSWICNFSIVYSIISSIVFLVVTKLTAACQLVHKWFDDLEPTQKALSGNYRSSSYTPYFTYIHNHSCQTISSTWRQGLIGRFLFSYAFLFIFTSASITMLPMQTWCQECKLIWYLIVFRVCSMFWHLYLAKKCQLEWTTRAERTYNNLLTRLTLSACMLL